MRYFSLIMFMVLIILSSFLFGCQSSWQISGSSFLPPTIPDAIYTGTDSCIPCHDDVFSQYKKTIHYKIKAFEVRIPEGGCETCHGPGSLHIKTKGNIEDIIGFARISPLESSAICLQCHKNSPTMNWWSNVHIVNGVGCTGCHKSHKVTAPKMVYLGDPAICFTCHQAKKTQNVLPSHHPILEGKMKCLNCHAVHGSENSTLVKDTLNDVCYECHAEYQGPYVFEHAPAVEDCSICHDPHGTIANNLLLQNEPFLCLRCHKGHRENPRTGPHPTMAAMLASCTQCHSQVHGSDLPSQLNGKGLSR